MIPTQSLRIHLALALALVGAGSSYLMTTAATSTPQTLHVPQLIPVGTILPFAGATVPEGYMLCDGTELSRAQYPKLFQAIDSSWGSATGFTFTLPDLRGRFLRGVDGAAGNDPDANTRGENAPGGNTGNNVGSVQGDARRGISGTVSGTTASAGLHSHNIFTYQDDYDEDDGNANSHNPGWADDRVSGPTDSTPTGSTGTHSHTFSVSASFAGDAETRPKNAYVNYIIKI